MTNNLELKTPELLVQHGYSYRELIGEGSNGKTYRAQNMKTGEVVAIKALKFSDNLKNYELFKREAEVLQSLNHPGIPRFFEFITGEKEFTECWIVQEFIEGQSVLDILEERQNEGKCFSIKETLELIYEAAEIVKMLQTDYVPPIIHRDIKPSNILIRKEKLNDFSVCLIDFGAVANPQKRSNQSTVAGTVGYMAPEQLIGDCSIQSDYYSLGATALHMLTGIAPSDFPADGFKLQFESILKEKVPDIPQELVQFLQSLMAPKIADRPQNIDELMTRMREMIKKINSGFVDQYRNAKNKFEKYDKRYNYIGGFSSFIYYSVVLVLGWIVVMLVLGTIKKLIVDNLIIENLMVENDAISLYAGLGITLYFIFIIAAKFYRPKKAVLNQLKENVRMLPVIEIKEPVSSKDTPSDVKDIMLSSDGWTVIKGTIAAVCDRRIEYYYLGKDDNFRSGYCVINEKMRVECKRRGIQFVVGEKIDLKYKCFKKRVFNDELRKYDVTTDYLSSIYLG